LKTSPSEAELQRELQEVRRAQLGAEGPAPPSVGRIVLRLLRYHLLCAVAFCLVVAIVTVAVSLWHLEALSVYVVVPIGLLAGAAYLHWMPME